MPEIIELHAGRSRLAVAPEVGGAICRFWSETAQGPVEWLRPTRSETIAAGQVSGMACFPLVPFSNRVREGRFACDGRTVVLGLNAPTMRHAIHGQGWQRPWTVASAGPSGLVLTLRHLPDAWPWRYAARLAFTLDGEGLAVELSVRNEDSRAMPAGIGCHPYFPRTPQCRVRAEVRGFWRTDAEVMPVELTAPPPHADLNKGVLVDAVSLDNNFTGWQGEAVIEWPEREARLTMRASPSLPFLVLYSPPGRDFFALEPVSHCTDAFNLMTTRPDTGAAMLAPGAELSGSFRLTPRIGH
jgi:aldose 1-epimerase